MVKAFADHGLACDQWTASLDGEGACLVEQR
jgi:hypothetical protein